MPSVTCCVRPTWLALFCVCPSDKLLLAMGLWSILSLGNRPSSSSLLSPPSVLWTLSRLLTHSRAWPPDLCLVIGSSLLLSHPRSLESILFSTLVNTVLQKSGCSLDRGTALGFWMHGSQDKPQRVAEIFNLDCQLVRLTIPTNFSFAGLSDSF